MPSRTSVVRRLRGEGGFLLRWVAAVATAVALAGAVEHAYASKQLQQRVAEESLLDYQADARALEVVLASGYETDAQLAAVRVELVRLLSRRGVKDVALFGSDGSILIQTGSGHAEDEHDLHAGDADLVDQVLATGAAWWGVEQEEGDVQEHRYEFLLPITTSAGPLVLEVDQRADIHAQLMAHLRSQELLGLLIAIAVAVPLSYLIGGRSLHRQQRRTQRDADSDALTGLLSRRPFGPALTRALAEPGSPVALALIDIDHFKRVNDKLGHSYGDRVLRALADSFAELRSTDTAFRLGGDEFAAVLRGADDEEAAAVLDRVRASLTSRMPGITISCGIASSRGTPELALEELWERADSALYEAKRRGRRRTVTFAMVSEHLTVTADKLDAVSALLSRAAELRVAFQPIWDLRRGCVLGHEALLRLPPDLPIDGPGEAFDLAQRLGLAAELDALARSAVLQAVGGQEWAGALFLNLHPEALRGLDVDVFAADAHAAGLQPCDLVVEVTEHADLDNSENVRMLKRLRASGFRLALDDLGQGNAGLRALTHVHFDVIKVDRQVIAQIGTDPAAAAVVSAATTFVAHSGGWVIAEGIEEVATVSALLGPDPAVVTPPVLAGQGYLLGRPAPRPVPLDASFTGLPAEPGLAPAS